MFKSELHLSPADPQHGGRLVSVLACLFRMTHVVLLTSWHQITLPALRSIFLSINKCATVRPTQSGD